MCTVTLLWPVTRTCCSPGAVGDGDDNDGDGDGSVAEDGVADVDGTTEFFRRGM